MKIIGIDIGNITTVYCTNGKHGVIESRLKQATEIKKLSQNTIFEYGNIEYLINDGYFENHIFKYKKPNFIKLLHYAIGEASQDQSIANIVIGIPVSQFTMEYKKELAAAIRHNKEIDIKIDKKRKRIVIDKILIRPESYGVFKLFQAENKIIKNVPSIVIDIGGGTTDISEYSAEGKFLNGESINSGLLNYYNNVKETVFNESGVTLTLEQAKEYTRGNFTYKNLDNNLHKINKQELFDEIYNNLLAKYKNIERYNVILSGGGVEAIADHFKKKIPDILIDEDITTNAKTFYQIGKQEFGNDEEGN